MPQPIYSYTLPRRPIEPIAEPASTYRIVVIRPNVIELVREPTFPETQLDIEEHTHADTPLLEDRLITAMAGLSIAPDHSQSNEPSLEITLETDADLTLPNLLPHYAGMLKDGAEKWITRKVLYRIQTTSQHDLAAMIGSKINEPVLAEWWRAVLLAGTRKQKPPLGEKAYRAWINKCVVSVRFHRGPSR
jgi:hypothetical protein